MAPERIESYSPASIRAAYPQPTPITPPASRGFLNDAAESVLNQFDRFGEWVEESFQKIDGSPEQTVASAISQVAGTKVGLDAGYKQRVLATTKQFGWDEGFIDRHFPSSYKPSRLMKGLSTAGSVIDAASGVLSVAVAFHHDREAKDNLYTRTMTQTAKSVGQMGVGYAAGILAAGTVTAGATIGLPFVVGAAAATGAAYLFGKAVDWAMS